MTATQWNGRHTIKAKPIRDTSYYLGWGIIILGLMLLLAGAMVYTATRDTSRFIDTAKLGWPIVLWAAGFLSEVVGNAMLYSCATERWQHQWLIDHGDVVFLKPDSIVVDCAASMAGKQKSRLMCVYQSKTGEPRTVSSEAIPTDKALEIMEKKLYILFLFDPTDDRTYYQEMSPAFIGTSDLLNRKGR